MAWTKKTNEAPEPFSEEEIAIIEAAQASFQFFLMYVFPMSFEGQKFPMADGQKHPFSLGFVHYQWAKIVEDHPRVCILAPRAHLKSTVMNHALSFWKMFSAGRDIDIIVMSYKDKLAAEHTGKIKKFILDNKLCRFWHDNKAAAESIVDFQISFNDGKEWNGKVDPYGVLSSVRGLHPDTLICDDILSDISGSLEPMEIRRIDQVFRQSLESLPDENDSLIVIGTPQSYEDTLYRLSKSTSYYWGRFSAEQVDKDGVVHPLWPEKFDLPRLKRTKRRAGATAYQVEYLLIPFFAVNSFIPIAVVESCIDIELKPFSLADAFDHFGIIGVYGGMDVGKEVHPTHISVGALMPTGDIVQIYQEFLDGMDYKAQAKHVRRIIEHFNIKRFYYDSTRAEMDDRDMSRRAIGIKFTSGRKAQMALSLESRFFADEDEPGIILLNDKRQTGQIVAVDRTLKSIATTEGHGDSTPAGYDILTKEGWKEISEVTLDDYIASPNKEGIIEYQKPYHLTKKRHTGELYSLRSEQVDLDVTPHHRMYVSTNKKDYKLEFAKDLLGKSRYYKKTVQWVGEERDEFVLPSYTEYHSCGDVKSRVIKEIVHPEITIPMDQWLEFLGWYISEGNCTKGKEVHIWQSPGEFYEEIRSVLDKLGFNYSEHSRRDGFTLYSKQLSLYLSPLGKSYEKYIPREFMGLPSSQLAILYSSMFKGDGAKITNVYSTSSKRLAGDVQEMFLKMGFSGNIRTLDNRGRSAPHGITRQLTYSICPLFNKTHPMVNKRGGQDKMIPYDDYVYCVSVPNELIVLRSPSGKVVLSGNSFWSVSLMLKAAEDGPIMQILGNAQDMFSGGAKPRSPAASLMAGRNF